MKHTVEQPIKVVEVSQHEIRDRRISPEQRNRFLESFSDVLTPPSKQKILDTIDILQDELGVSFYDWNIRWEDTVGEYQYTDIKYIDYSFDFPITYDEQTYEKLYQNQLDKLEKAEERYKNTKWYNFINKIGYKIDLFVARKELVEIKCCIKNVYTYPSFKRSYYLDVYY